MNAHDNADMLIKTIKIWQFLQHVDELVDNGDRKASIVVTDFFKRYDLPFEISVENLKSAGVLPFAQLKTTVSLLLITLCFARRKVFTRERVDDPDWDKAGMRHPSTYDLDCRSPRDPDISQVIRTMRDAAAHAFDRDNSILFPEGKIVSFQAIRGDRVGSIVTFCTVDGFVDFLKDYIRAVQNEVITQMNNNHIRNRNMGDDIFGDKEHQVVAREALPVLIEKAKAGETINYGTLADKLGIPSHKYPMPQMLASIVTTLYEFGVEWQEDLPYLTALVVKRSTGYPGFPQRIPNEVFDAEFERIYNYLKWDAVQQTLLSDARAAETTEAVILKNLSTDGNGLREVLRRFLFR